MTPRQQIAADSWDVVQDWVGALVAACDAKGASQNTGAKRLGFSATVVSQVLRNDYPGNMANVESRVRAILTPNDVNCPALGPIDSADCLAWRDKADALNSVSPIIVRMYGACRRCPRYTQEDQE